MDLTFTKRERKMLTAYMEEKAKYLERYHESDRDTTGAHLHELKTSPLITLETKCAAELPQSGSESPFFPQYGLLGFHVGEHDQIEKQEPVLLNTDAPNSTFICGSQGSGKSYTLACMLENCLLKDSSTGQLTSPIAGVVFHYDIDAGSSIAEAARLCSRGIKVNVLVSKSNEYALRNAYEHLEGANKYLTVKPLLLRSKDLSVERMNKLMAFSESEGRVPLYMECIQRILREMAINNAGQPFDYGAFLNRLKNERFTKEQSSPMDLRLNLLESFMDWPRTKASKKALFDLQPGTLTIIDLTDPFVDAATVCVLFDICLSLVKENRPKAGLVIALDEAHKFMNTSAAAANFTDRLLTTIREQRHNATRVIIATQEPTISEKLLDLCSISIVHRFTSPAWFNTLRTHLGAASNLIASEDDRKDLLNKIIDLQTGESFVFSPSSFVCIENGLPKKLASGLMKMKTRGRLGADGGKSKMATAKGDDEETELEKKLGGMGMGSYVGGLDFNTSSGSTFTFGEQLGR